MPDGYFRAPPSAAEQTRLAAFQADATRQDILQRLRTATPAQIRTYVANQVTGTTVAQVRAQTIDMLVAILIAIALDARQ